MPPEDSQRLKPNSARAGWATWMLSFRPQKRIKWEIGFCFGGVVRMSKICLVESLTSTGGQSFVVGFEASAAWRRFMRWLNLARGRCFLRRVPEDLERTGTRSAH